MLGSARLWLWKGGMDLLGSVWNGYGKVLLVVEEKGVLGPQCSLKHNAFDSSLCGCDLTTSISSPRTSHGNNCESAQTDDCAGNHPRSTPQKPMFRTSFVTCSRTHQGMDTDGLENGCSPQKKSPKKPINRMCLGEESTDDSTQSGNSTTGQRQRGPPRSSAMGTPATH